VDDVAGWHRLFGLSLAIFRVRFAPGAIFPVWRFSLPLIIMPPPPGFARLRFVARKGNWLSALINWREMSHVSHVEAVMPDGSIIAALIGEGVVRKPNDYDKTSTMQIIVDVEMSDFALHDWQKYLESRLGRPYDLTAIIGIAFHVDRRRRGSFFCSMVQTLALRASGTFAKPLSEPAHEIMPRDLLLMLSAHPSAAVHEKETTT
jgi:hypothetical protein